MTKIWVGVAVGRPVAGMCFLTLMRGSLTEFLRPRAGRARAGESLPAEPEACARVSAANAQRQRSSNVHLLNRGARVAQHIFTPERVMNRMS